MKKSELLIMFVDKYISLWEFKSICVINRKCKINHVKHVVFLGESSMFILFGFICYYDVRVGTYVRLTIDLIHWNYCYTHMEDFVNLFIELRYYYCATCVGGGIILLRISHPLLLLWWMCGVLNLYHWYIIWFLNNVFPWEGLYYELLRFGWFEIIHVIVVLILLCLLFSIIMHTHLSLIFMKLLLLYYLDSLLTKNGGKVDWWDFD